MPAISLDNEDVITRPSSTSLGSRVSGRRPSSHTHTPGASSRGMTPVGDTPSGASGSTMKPMKTISGNIGPLAGLAKSDRSSRLHDIFAKDSKSKLGIEDDDDDDEDEDDFVEKHSHHYQSSGSTIVEDRKAGKFDGQCGYLRLAQAYVADIVKNRFFDTFMGMIIILNAVTVGMEQTLTVDTGKEGTFDAEGFRCLDSRCVITVRSLGMVENCFLCLYCIELLMRFIGFGVWCLRDRWVQFDCLLVIVGILSVAILRPSSAEEDGNQADELGPLMVLRMARLGRIARTVRLLIKFPELWMLVRGLMNSAATMCYTLIILFVILYIFSCIGLEMVAKSPVYHEDLRFQEIADRYFPSLMVTMLTLSQFVSMDSIGAIYKPLIEMDPRLTIYFGSVILVIPVVLMNLVTAVIVNNAMEQAASDKDAKRVHEADRRKKLMRQMRKVFKRIDSDGSGQISCDEIINVNEADLETLRGITKLADPMDIFNALDLDHSGIIDIEEFVDAMWQAHICQVPVEHQRMEKQVGVMFQELKESMALTRGIFEVVGNIHASHGQLCSSMSILTGEPLLLEDEEDAKVSFSNSSFAGKTSASAVASASVGCKDTTKSIGMSSGFERNLQKGEGSAMPAWARELTAELRLLREEGVRIVVGQVDSRYDAAAGEEKATDEKAARLPPTGASRPPKAVSAEAEAFPGFETVTSKGIGPQLPRFSTAAPVAEDHPEARQGIFPATALPSNGREVANSAVAPYLPAEENAALRRELAAAHAALLQLLRGARQVDTDAMPSCKPLLLKAAHSFTAGGAAQIPPEPLAQTSSTTRASRLSIAASDAQQAAAQTDVNGVTVQKRSYTASKLTPAASAKAPVDAGATSNGLATKEAAAAAAAASRGRDSAPATQKSIPVLKSKASAKVQPKKLTSGAAASEGASNDTGGAAGPPARQNS